MNYFIPFFMMSFLLGSCAPFGGGPNALEMKDRFRGATLGTYLGDALGKGVEYVYRHRPEQAPKSYVDRSIIKMEERRDSRYPGLDGYQPAGTYTDDTEEMIALLNSLVENRGWVDQQHLANSLGQHFRFNHGYSSKTSKLLKKLKERPADWKEIVMTKNRMVYESNGCAMRIAPIGLLGYKLSDGELRSLVTRQCQVTHPGSVSIEGAALVAKAIQLALKSPIGRFSPEKFVGELILFCQHPALCERLKNVRVLLYKNPSLVDEVRALRNKNEFGVGFKILDSIPAVIYLVARYHRSLEKGLNAAVQVSLAGDSDTIPAMVGAIL
ncbi:MAG: ADP-ribosylglycohydrolase family protein, partial [Halobacteriovoraceae bacterium]|nr:ADP-ribosylglycohydrolase family protein [Halobacteriovoraceae bacterium]